MQHHGAARAHDEVTGSGELAEVGHVDAVAFASLPQLVDVVGRDGEDHPLLGLGQPDLPRLEAWILERHGVELDVGADHLGHLADRRREPAGAAVGDGRPQMLGTVEHVDQQLLGHRVADLHARPGDLAGRGVHRRAGERRPADPVATGCPAEQDDPITRMRAGRRLALGGAADATAEDQRVGGELVVVEHGPGDGRQTDLVAVVGDAGDDALADAPRMQGAFRQRLGGEVGGSEAQHVGDGDRPVAGSEHVADDATDPRVGAAERLDGRRMVVRLGLQRQRLALGERHDPGVADERRADVLGADPLGGVAELAQQRCDVVSVDRDRRPERLVGAVLAPRLGQRLQLDVDRIATASREVVADGDQLLPVEGERSGRVEGVQAGVVEVPNRDDRGRRHVVTAWVEDRLDAFVGPPLDDGVGDDPAHQGVDGRRVATRWKFDASSGRRGHDRDPELGRRVDDGVGGGVGDPGVERDLHSTGCVVVGGIVPRGCLQQRVGQEVGQAATSVVVEIALDEGDVADRHGAGELDVVGRRGGDDRRFSRVVTDCLDGQSRPGWHCSDPTTPIA